MFNKFTALETLAVVDARVTERRLEAIQAGETIISLLDQMKSDVNMDPYCRERETNISFSVEIDTCQYLARLYAHTNTPEENEKVIKYSQRAIDVCREKGDDEQTKQLERALEMQIAKLSRKHEGIREEREYKQAEATLPEAREYYDIVVSRDGENSATVIPYGKNLGLMLLKAGYGIECERLFAKLVLSSRLVFGPDHPESKSLAVFRDQSKWRNILIPDSFDNNARPDQMRVVGYDGDCGNWYALSGMTRRDPRSLSINCDDDETYWIQPGTPVVCKGLQSATHLNGQIGDVRRRDKSTKRYAVHFADPSLKSRSILGRNLRVLINVPEENEVTGDALDPILG